jgi:plasmid stabilization system protein ParE
MKFSVSTLGGAEADIGRIYAWIADRSAQGASNWYQSARKAIDELARDAHQHERAPESGALGRDVRQKIL